MGMGFAPTWLRQVSPPPASQNQFNHCMESRSCQLGDFSNRAVSGLLSFLGSCFPVFSTVCLKLAVANSSHQRFSVCLKSRLKTFLFTQRLLPNSDPTWRQRLWSYDRIWRYKNSIIVIIIILSNSTQRNYCQTQMLHMRNFVRVPTTPRRISQNSTEPACNPHSTCHVQLWTADYKRVVTSLAQQTLQSWSCDYNEIGRRSNMHTVRRKKTTTYKTYAVRRVSKHQFAHRHRLDVIARKKQSQKHRKMPVTRVI